jgi:hypothetical protein
MRSPRSRTDGNQAEIVAALRKAGATVQDLHTVGMGCPDLLVGYRGVNYLIEVKRPGETMNKRELFWHVEWEGPVEIAQSPEQALTIIGATEEIA